MSEKKDDENGYLGYFATILLALIVSIWVARQLSEQVFDLSGPDLILAEQNATAAIFFAICFVNPIKAFTRKSSLFNILSLLFLGAVFGYWVRTQFIDVYVGEGLSRIALMSIAAAALPFMMVRDRMKQSQFRQTRRLIASLRRKLGWMARLPFRAVFMGMMILSYLAFSLLTTSVVQGLWCLGAVVLTMTLAAACRRPAAVQDDPDRTDSDPAAAKEHVLSALLPAAAFFGGMTWFAGKLIPVLVTMPVTASETLSQRLLSALELGFFGLCVVLIGAIAALISGAVLLRVIGHYLRWSPSRTRDAMWEMFRGLAFRPVTNNG